MSNDKKLLVPMYMEALLLRNDKKDCLDLSPDFSQYNQSVLGDVLQPPALQNSTNTLTLKKGIHIHWTLPKALKHTFLEEGSSEMNFPLAPNRWMIIRMRTDTSMNTDADMKIPIPTRIWVVESDFTNADSITTLQLPNDFTPNIVVIEDNKIHFKNIGKAFDYPYTSTNQSELFLTAVSAANPFFASFYPGCRNVFGFHDDMKDVPDKCTLTYLVTGWYSDPGSDPLAPLPFTGEPKTDAQRKLKREFDWFRQQWKYASKDYPESCLLHAAIQNISWSDDVQPASGVPDGQVSVFVGNTSSEAFSAQFIMQNALTTKPHAEELLNALQYELLLDDSNPPGLAEITAEIHKRSFRTKNSGTLWEITRAEAPDQQLEEQTEERLNFPFDTDMLADYKQLNNYQAKRNILALEIQSLQQEYYLLWYKQAQDIVNGYGPIKGFDYNGSRATIKGLIDSKTSALQNCDREIGIQKDKLMAYPELSGKDPQFVLKEKRDERFWEPADPVLLLSGSGIGKTDSPYFQPNDKEIDCRTIDQVITQLNLVVPNGSTNIPESILSSDFDVPGLKNGNVPEEISKLVFEALLLDNGLLIDIALLAYTKADLVGDGPDKKDKTSQSILDFAKTVVPLQKDALNKNSDTTQAITDGQPPESYAIQNWQQAWSPLFVLWKVNFSPYNNDITNLDLSTTGNWQLEQGSFFTSKSDSTNLPPITISNFGPLSTSILATLNRTLPADILTKYGSPNLLAQSLSGLHKNLLMQIPTIQLPPLKYSPDEDYQFKTYWEIDQDEFNVIGSEAYRLGSNPGETDGTDGNQFYPLRAGLMEICNLNIVDSFGQARKIIVEGDSNNPPVTSAASMKTATTGNKIFLAPRILQPSRIKFQWLNKADEIIFQDTGKLAPPVFGWLVPNYLDNSLMVYDESGGEIAVLQIVKDVASTDGLRLEPKPFPGADVVPDLSGNPHLENILNTLSSGSVVAGLLDLALKINLNNAQSRAMKNNTAAIICGQPIALARCSVQVSFMGLPAYNQRWDQSGKQNSGGIETVKIPLYFGNYLKEKDGLLGYFPDTDSSPAFYTTMNSPVFENSENPFFKSNTPLKIAANQGEVKMTLLLDPSAGVSIASAILPDKYVELFQYSAKKLLSSLNTGFMVAPFLAEKVEPGIPVPSAINGNWKWTHKSDVQTWQKDSDVDEGKNKQLSFFKKQQLYEGWLRLNNVKPNN